MSISSDREGNDIKRLLDALKAVFRHSSLLIPGLIYGGVIFAIAMLATFIILACAIPQFIQTTPNELMQLNIFVFLGLFPPAAWLLIGLMILLITVLSALYSCAVYSPLKRVLTEDSGCRVRLNPDDFKSGIWNHFPRLLAREALAACLGVIAAALLVLMISAAAQSVSRKPMLAIVYALVFSVYPLIGSLLSVFALPPLILWIPIMVYENVGPLRALVRAFSMIRGAYLGTLGVLLLAHIAYWAASLLCAAIPLLNMLLLPLFAVFLALYYVPITATYSMMLYRDIAIDRQARSLSR